MKSKEIDIYDNQSVNVWLKTIHVNKNGKLFCNLINEHNRELEEREKKKKDKYLAQLPHEILWQMGKNRYIYSNRRNSVILDIQTSEKVRNRAYCFLDTFITCIKELEGTVQVDTTEPEDNTQFTLLQSTYICHLAEVQVKLRNVLELNSRVMHPLYEPVGTGKLKFLIDEKQHINHSGNASIKKLWSIEDDDVEKIEDKLIDVLSRLIQDALSKKIVIDLENEKRQKEYEEQRKKWDEERRQEELEEHRKKLLKDKQQAQLKIEKHMDKWNYINKMITYITELRQSSNMIEDDRLLIEKYCSYVEEVYDKKEFYKEIIEFTKELSVINEENI